MEIKKVCKVEVFHLGPDEDNVSHVSTETLSGETSSKLISEVFKKYDGLDISEEELQSYIQKAMHTPGMDPITLWEGEPIPNTHNDAMNWAHYGFPTELVKLHIDHVTDITVIVGGQEFSMPAVRVM